jgi:hypothetical protein
MTMANHLATLNEQLAELKAARASGARRVRFRSGDGEREVEFRMDSELVAAIGALEREIAGLEAARARPRIVYVHTERGW